MAEYQLTATEDGVRRVSDGAYIPCEELNLDWLAYQDWLTGGGVPEPYTPPPETKAESPYVTREQFEALQKRIENLERG
jgi:hypothetical protein